ncbi:hypothetical protein FACS1894153_2810 [Bacteroidia bacterium]|nr:hypothetical protein FACS1894153_2810 [Bacteroidia bacterium]
MYYHYLISSLPELYFSEKIKEHIFSDLVSDEKQNAFSFQSLFDEIKVNITPKDKNFVNMILMPYDHQNLINLLHHREDLFIEKGLFDLNFLKNQIENEGDLLPPYQKEIIMQYHLGENVEDESFDKHNMEFVAWSRFYEFVQTTQTEAEFIKKWFAFDKILRNIQSAWNCKKLGVDMSQQILGLEEDVNVFVKSNLPDYGLRREIPLGNEIFALLENNDVDILEREFQFDKIKWHIAEELTTFNYFDINFILAFLVKADILDRWQKLNKTKGKEQLEDLVTNLTKK